MILDEWIAENHIENVMQEDMGYSKHFFVSKYSKIYRSE